MPFPVRYAGCRFPALKGVWDMNGFSRSIATSFKGAGKAFLSFPAVIACAAGFTLVTIIRIHLDWPLQEPYNFLFGCLHWSFAFGAAFSLVPILVARNRMDRPGSFLAANLLGGLAAGIVFPILYLTGGIIPEGARIAKLQNIAVTRLSMGILISLIVFVILAGHPKDQSDFSRSLFMTLKAFFIALIYGLVLMGGTSGVARAIQALLYRDMSIKVFQYLGTLVGFLAFAIFIGYFPDFHMGKVDEHRETAQKQPRFIEILLGTIAIPIALALTAVLLAWAGRILITGEWPVFLQLSGIAASYAVGGLLLHVLVTHHETGLAKFYRQVYPISALVILVFEAWAWILQVKEVGLKMASYSFGLVWLLAVTAMVLLLILKSRAHTLIAVIACSLAFLSVLPVVGLHALPVTAQVNRLESLLKEQNMLAGDSLSPASAMPDLTTREGITDAVDYLVRAEKANLPAWFDERLDNNNRFKEIFGFEKTWPKIDKFAESGSTPIGMFLTLEPGAVDIGDYHWAVNMQINESKGGIPVMVEGENGLYRIVWTVNTVSGIPDLNIMLDDREILVQDMNAYIERISSTFPTNEGKPQNASLHDMSVRFDTPELSVLLVFDHVDVFVEPDADRMNYWLNLNTIYLKEKK